MKRDHAQKLAVIGAGFTGLACATQLVQKGHSVTLFEKSDVCGGLASGFKEAGWNFSLEKYYHHWFKSDQFVFKFAKIWNAEDKLLFLNPLTGFESQSGKFVALDSAFALLRFPDINFFQRLRMGIALAYLKLKKNWLDLETITAEKWCRKYMGDKGFEAIWQPLLLGKFGEKYASEVNMAWLWARLTCRTKQLGTFSGGFQAFVECGEKFLSKHNVQIIKNCGDIKVAKSSQRWLISRESLAEEFDSVVIAASPQTLQQIVPSYQNTSPTPPSLGARVVIFSFKNPLGKKFYWYSLKKTKEHPFLALIEHTKFISSQEFNGEHLVYVADYLSPHSDEWKITDEELTQKAFLTCQKIRPGLDKSEINRSWIFKEAYAQPVMGVDASQFLPSYEVPDHPNLYHASLAHVYPWDRGTNFALELGETIAKLV